MNGNYAAVGIVVSVWLWAAQNAVDGNLSEYAPEDIADAIGWKKAAEKLLDALVSAGFIDRAEDGSLSIHDWDEHAAMFQSSVETQREKNRKRVQKWRDEQKRKRNGEVTPECNGDVMAVTPDVTLQEALHVTDVTPLPDQTIPNHTKINCGDGGEYAPARNATAEELALIGLTPGEYLGVTAYTVQRVRRAAAALFQACRFGEPSPFDCRHVFCRTAIRQTEVGVDVDPELLKLLAYAFEQANAAGKPRDWNYVEGVMSNCAARDIRTLQQARDYDRRRHDGEDCA